MFARRLALFVSCSSLAACGVTQAPSSLVLRSGSSGHAVVRAAQPAAPSGTPPVSAVATNAADVSEPFTCSVPVVRQPSGASLANPTTAKVGSQPGFDRIVFEYAGPDLPWITVNSAARPFAHDPSGLPLAVTGKVFLAIVFPKLPGITSGYSGPTSFKAGFPVLIDMELRVDFEGVQSWVAGLSGPACVRIFSLTSPSRLVVDLESASPPGLPSAGLQAAR